MRIRLGCVVIVLAVGVGVASVQEESAASAVSAVASAAVPRLVWHRCASAEQKGFQCATARVPLDYRYPRGAMIQLAVIRHLARDRARRVGTLFFNPGGPGGSGSMFLPAVVEHLPALSARFDWVSWDPRGSGASTAVQCFASRRAEVRFLAGIPAGSFPVGSAEMGRWIRRFRLYDLLCAERDGTLLAHVSTADTARDLDLLRRAVGARMLNYLGQSYGTFLGATYANLFPNRVRAMVLDSNEPPSAWVGRQVTENGGVFLSTFLRDRSDQGSAKTLGAFLDLCGRADTAHCAFSGGSAAATRAKFATLLRRLPKHDTSGPSYAEVVSAMVVALYRSASWSEAATGLQQLWTNSARNKLAPDRPGLPMPTPRVSPAAADRAGNAVHRYSGPEQLWAITCAESPNPLPADFPRLDAFASHRSGVVGAYWVWILEPCASWPATASDRYAGPWNRRTANPVLVVGTTYDPATPYQGAVAMSRQLARARLLTIDGYGHGAPSPCANRYVSRYFVNLILPPKRARCQQYPQPFNAR